MLTYFFIFLSVLVAHMLEHGLGVRTSQTVAPLRSRTTKNGAIGVAISEREVSFVVDDRLSRHA